MAKPPTSQLRQLAMAVAKNAWSPYSKACVGAAIETMDGSFFCGCNIENASYGGSVCAERVAIFNMITEGKRKMKKIYIYTENGWPPCGLCRQVMVEFASDDLQIIMGDAQGREKIMSLGDLLPKAFTSDELNA